MGCGLAVVSNRGKKKVMITVIAGTNRVGSRSLHLAKQMVRWYEEAGEAVTLLDLSTLPVSIFAPSVYGEKPAEFVTRFIEPVMAADGLHLVIPEYNGSFPGALKYFIDLLPFPEAFDGRPTAFVGISAGGSGGVRPVEHMQQFFGYRNAYIYPRRVFIPEIYKVMDADGLLTDESLVERLRFQIQKFSQFTRQMSVKE